MQIKKLAQDPAEGDKITPGSLIEARDAVELEEVGVLRKVRRATGNGRESGADFVDGNGRLYDHKVATSERGNFKARPFVDQIVRKDIGAGETIILNRRSLSEPDLQALLQEIDSRDLRAHFIFHPPL